jgi:hypothetical protein
MKHISSIAAGLISLVLATSAIGACSDGGNAPGMCGVEANHPFMVAEVKLKDCSKMTKCFDRCQCQYDNCVAPCGDTDAKCVNKCISDWEKCREGC